MKLVKGHEKNQEWKVSKDGNMYTTRQLYERDGISGLSGNSGKPLTPLRRSICELINYYLTTSRPFNALRGGAG